MNICLKVASQLPKSYKTFEAYLSKVNVIMDSKPLSINKLKAPLFSLKINKKSGVDDVSFIINKKMLWGAMRTLNLLNLFQLSLVKGVFPDKLKMAKVTLIHKACDSSDISN